VQAPIGIVAVQVTNPATGKHIATLPKMDADDTKAAIAAAASVYPQWSSLTAKERSKYLKR
jgi:succinate-semialdehyde dehydrogenase/glutarate-semialdehyde dehydrogenase